VNQGEIFIYDQQSEDEKKGVDEDDGWAVSALHAAGKPD